MGYESKLYVVEKSKYIFNDVGDKSYGSVIAMFDVCKCQGVRDIFTQDATCYIYGDDGAEIVEDKYGDALKEAPLHEVAINLEIMIAGGNTYRRLVPLFNLLKSFESKTWPDLVVLHYGY